MNRYEKQRYYNNYKIQKKRKTKKYYLKMKRNKNTIKK